MNYTDEEVELITAWHEKRKAFLAAKEAHEAAPDDEATTATYESTKREMSEFRSHWRAIREYAAATAEDVTELDDGDVVAVSPGTVGVGNEINGGKDTEVEA